MASLLLVDDDDELSELLRDLFVSSGYQVDVVTDGQGALEQLSTGNQYDLILLDWQLPDSSGVEVCRRYRNSGGTAPVLMLTGVRDAIAPEVCMNCGANSIFTKPFSSDEVIRKIRSMLEDQR